MFCCFKKQKFDASIKEFFKSVAKGELEKVKQGVAAGLDINMVYSEPNYQEGRLLDITAVIVTGHTVLQTAVRNGRVEIVDYLLQLKQVPQQSSQVAYSMIYQHYQLPWLANRDEICLLLINNGANVSRDDLFQAIANGMSKTFEHLFAMNPASYEREDLLAYAFSDRYLPELEILKSILRLDTKITAEQLQSQIESIITKRINDWGSDCNTIFPIIDVLAEAKSKLGESIHTVFADILDFTEKHFAAVGNPEIWFVSLVASERLLPDGSTEALPAPRWRQLGMEQAALAKRAGLVKHLKEKSENLTAQPVLHTMQT